MLKNRAYLYAASTQSFCPACEKLIPTKIVYQNEKVYLLKNCPVHGELTELFEEDLSYHLRKSQFDKPGTMPKTETIIEKGCPFDCGLCPNHDQHTCIGLIEITTQCDLHCPVCYANAGEGTHLSLEKIKKMMQFYMDAEDQNAEILQISGGEPTTHPEILNIIQMAKEIGFKYVMLNTNGIRIAEDEEFVKELAKFSGGFEVYLQFDGLTNDVYEKLRGKKLLQIKEKAIENLTDNKIPTTLVCTVDKDINDNQIGGILGLAMNTKYIRGVNFQPVAFFGRAKNSNTSDRITLSGVLKRIEKQTNGLIRSTDFIPLPCNVERVAITYLLKGKDGFIAVTRNQEFEKYTSFFNNTFIFTVEDVLKNAKDTIFNPFQTCKCFDFMKLFQKYIPSDFQHKSKKERMDFVDENTFRISVSSFLDMHNFDMKSMQKECVHIITEDLKRIPFSAYNMLHRG